MLIDFAGVLIDFAGVLAKCKNFTKELVRVSAGVFAGELEDSSPAEIFFTRQN